MKYKLQMTPDQVVERAVEAVKHARNFTDEFANHPNEQIRKARALALNILKPTPKQIERGLELHRESVVFDSYGFAPRCAIDGLKMKALLEQPVGG